MEILFVRFVLSFLVYFRCSSGFIYAARHVLCTMAARPHATFAHTKTVRMMVEDGMEINALEIVRSLPDFKEEITGIVPNFRGKCFNITLRSTDAATRLATPAFDYGAERKPLKLLGARTIHVSVFVAVEYPDQKIVNFLKQYGQMKSENLRCPCYTKEGFTSIERGICVAEFTSLNRDLPRKVVTQGLEIFFKYTGQPITCYRYGSTEHVVKNCPKQLYCHRNDLHHRNDTGGQHRNDPRNTGNGIKRTTKTGQQFSTCYLFIYIASFLWSVNYLLPHFILQ